MDINDQVITMLFPGFARKIEEDYERYNIDIDPDSFAFYNDGAMTKMFRVGVYGLCELVRPMDRDWETTL
jgi:hypothetical protein